MEPVREYTMNFEGGLKNQWFSQLSFILPFFLENMPGEKAWDYGWWG